MTLNLWFLLVLLAPPFFVVTHTWLGFVLMLFYGVDKWRWRAGAIEVMAGKKKDGTTKIWFQPGAQTWGLIIFCADGYNYERAPLQVHERVHILQTILFGSFYTATYALSFVFFFVIVKLQFDWWKRHVNQRGIPDDDVWHAYRMIPWERWAYAKQARFEKGEIPKACGAFDA